VLRITIAQEVQAAPVSVLDRILFLIHGRIVQPRRLPAQAQAQPASSPMSCHYSSRHHVRDGCPVGYAVRSLPAVSIPAPCRQTKSLALIKVECSFRTGSMGRIGRNTGQAVTLGRATPSDLTTRRLDQTLRSQDTVQTGFEGFTWRPRRSIGRAAGHRRHRGCGVPGTQTDTGSAWSWTPIRRRAIRHTHPVRPAFLTGSHDRMAFILESTEH
jgi:hypothetical protein